jgi:phage recombination protein Bet
VRLQQEEREIMSNVATIRTPKTSLLEAMATSYGMEPAMFERTIRATVMPKDHSVEEFAACMLVAHQHKLNPITREIFFMRSKTGGIQPIVSVDGWVTITNSHPQFDGMEFVDHQDGKALSSITCRMFRKDRSKPIEVTEYMSECKGGSPAWQKTPSRMLRHRAMIQCARYAFGFAGIMETDEFQQWQETPEKKSAYQARKDGDFVKLTTGIAQCTSDAGVNEFIAQNTDVIAKMPNSWQEHWAEHVVAARRRVTATPAEIVEEPADDTTTARELITTAINVEMLNHIREACPDADWENLAPEYDAKLESLTAAAAE